MNVQGICLVGRPGAGKSVIAKLLASEWPDGLEYIGAGDIARKLAAEDPEVADCLNNGRMAPEDKMRGAIEKALNEIVSKGKMFVTEGFPRDIEQYEWLLRSGFYFMMVAVTTPEIICRRRLYQRGRYDDMAHIIEKRMDFYRDRTAKIPIDSFDYIFNNDEDIDINGPKGIIMAHKITYLLRAVHQFIQYGR